LMVAGCITLARRRLDWQALLANNRALALFFLYCGISVLWSDYPFVSLKRWFKDIGNVIMVLVVLTETDPVRAAKKVFARCSYVLIPYSILLFKYYPLYGRAYDRWTGATYYTGVTLGKNALGATLLFCAVTLTWSCLYLRNQSVSRRERGELTDHGLLLLLTAWLLTQANSSTSLASSVLGGGALLAYQFAPLRKQVKHLALYILAGMLLFVGLREPVAQLLGRDLTLTGRTDIWQLTLAEGSSLLLGVGYYSFWMPARAERISTSGGFYYNLNEAHNGYLDLYLDVGLIGVVLLLIVLASQSRRINLEVLSRHEFAALRVAVLIVTVAYNLTESAFCRQSLIWFAFLLTTIEVPRAFWEGRACSHSELPAMDGQHTEAALSSAAH
jgi:exopolysaccharide production protein ExoQ